MYIKSIVLDGFKSYGNRVEVTGFDPEFNAITGLNGTGKSNILDSICFVLGITNLSNVRAGSLQELIYKHGQAGITKATVSITFDNRDKKQCPIGYENHDEITVTRQVVMGGKNKYLINGINVQNKRVSDLFCSVQLNVNNPHFLIMQGRITKVLNMKPPEILSMVEEAAGTRMYEAKKQAAQKTIEKKDAKLRELNDIIKEDIAPKLQKLQDERSQFQEYQKVVRELESLTRLHVAYSYVTAEENAKKSDEKVTEVKNEIQRHKEQVKENSKEEKQLEQQVADLSRKLDEESGNVLKELQVELTALEKVEAGAAAAARAAKDARSTHGAHTRLLQRSRAEDGAALEERQKQVDQVSAMFEKLKAASEKSEAELSAAQAKFLAVSTGLEDGAESLQEQLMAAKQQAAESSTVVSQCGMERAGLRRRLAALQTQAAAAGPAHRDAAALAHHRAQRDKLQEELSRSQFDEAQYNSLKESVRSLQSTLRHKRDELDRSAARLSRCDFSYSDPEPHFDRSRVHGTVCRLFEVGEARHCTALETAAGGRLYNVVVDTEVTSKLLLQRGNLQSRTTIIPLNKISSQPIEQRTVALAQQIGGGPENVWLALDLISFPARLRPALAWVFGQTLVCRTLEIAKKVTFHPQVKRRCVTLDGDVFDPSGTLSGGARVKGGSVLLQLQELRALELETAALAERLAASTEQLHGAKLAAEAHAALQQRFEMVSHEVEVLQSHVATSSHARLQEEISTLEEQLQELEQKTKAATETQKEAEGRAKELEEKVKDIKGHREREFKKAEDALKKAKKTHEMCSGEWRAREQEYEALVVEVAALRQNVASSAQQWELAAAQASDLEHQLATAEEHHRAAKEAVKAMQARINKQKTEIAHKSGDIARLSKRREVLAASSQELELKVQELEHTVTELQGEAAHCAKRMKSLVAEHPWIPAERQYFGAAGGAYELGGPPPGPRLAALAARRDKLARGVNARAHTLLGKEEEQYQDVMRKKKIVETDRAKLVQVMAELDEKKKRTLVAACEQVNRDFGSIFSSLLPGAQACLKPPDGLSVLDGLEVRVGFNNTWKESLGELSGGQRSLVALSLVLAMLLFKPAPLYILDEVDAALDLSHTQNIGHMLREHFTHSQFIIVSLKDGMFNNANVLFRTRFVDGMSAVQRTVNQRR